MNIGEIKAFLGDKLNGERPDVAAKQQLRDAGLQQAAAGIGQQSSLKISAFSSQTTVGLRVYNNSLNQTLTVGERKANLPSPGSEQKPLFDFEEIAKNVLNFVGGVIRGAAQSGADEEELTSLFDQARSGVAKGIALAEKDLEGFLNDEIRNGIDQSAELIEQGISSLEDELFGRQQASEGILSSSVTQLAYEREESGELEIRTRDGDVVTIRFEDREAFEFNRQQLLLRAETQPIEPAPETQSASDDSATTSEDENGQSASDSTDAASATPVSQQGVSTQSARFVEEQSFSFSVQGQLDEGELAAISDLVSDANELATDFFAGDVQGAFEQALELGFNEQELAGFALQLTRQEQASVVQAYETVSLYDDKREQNADPAKAVKPVSDYLSRMLNVIEQANQLLENGDEYENLLNSIVNEVQDVGTEDLISAINRFHSFNNNLLSRLPSQSSTEN